MTFATASRRPRFFIASLAAFGFAATTMPACYFNFQPVGVSSNTGDSDGDGFKLSGDCDDEDPNVFPGAGERCDDGVDNDCDGKIDAADPECQSDATTSGSGGSGGSAATSGSGGAGGNAAMSGSGGSGGSAATSGSGGVGGSAATSGSGGSGGAG